MKQMMIAAAALFTLGTGIAQAQDVPQTLTPSQAYPAPAPLKAYPACKPGREDNCRQRQ